MHELSLLQSMLDIIAAEAKTQVFSRVLTIRVEVGTLSCVQAEALRFGFDVAARGTLAENARLEIITVPGQAWCWDCATVVSIHELGAPCPLCGQTRLQVRGGDHLRVLDLEVS